MVSCDGQTLLGKQLFDVLSTLLLVMGVEDQSLDQGLGLLPTRFPDGFDG